MAPRSLTKVRSVRSLTRVPSVNPSDSEALAVAVRKLEVPVANINDGSVLMKLAEEHLESLKRLVPSRPVGPEGDLTWGSMCSGSEGPHFAFLALEAALGKNGLRCNFKHLFSCEITPHKARMDSESAGPAWKRQLLLQGCVQHVKAVSPVHGAWERLCPRLWISWWSERVART